MESVQQRVVKEVKESYVRFLDALWIDHFACPDCGNKLHIDDLFCPCGWDIRDTGCGC